MIRLIDRALALNPSFARGWYLSGLLRIWPGQSDRAIEDIQTSLRLSPRDRTGQPLTVMGLAYFFEGKFDETAAKLLLSIQRRSRLSHLVPRSRCLLYSYGAARRSARNRRPAPRDHPPKSFRAIYLIGTPSTASCSCRVCAWRPARRE